MSIETEVKKLTAAVDALTAALKAVTPAPVEYREVAPAERHVDETGDYVPAPEPEVETPEAAQAEAAREAVIQKEYDDEDANVTKDSAVAYITRVCNEIGIPEAKRILAEFGGAQKLTEIPQDQWGDVQRALRDRLAAHEAERG